MDKTIQNIKAIALLVCFTLSLGSAAFAQKPQSSVNKRKFLTDAEVVYEFEQMLKQTSDACDKMWLGNFIASASVGAGDTEKAKTYALSMLTQVGTISPDCDAGQSIHIGNLVLGHIALGEGNIA